LACYYTTALPHYLSSSPIPSVTRDKASESESGDRLRSDLIEVQNTPRTSASPTRTPKLGHTSSKPPQSSLQAKGRPGTDSSIKRIRGRIILRFPIIDLVRYQGSLAPLTEPTPLGTPALCGCAVSTIPAEVKRQSLSKNLPQLSPTRAPKHADMEAVFINKTNPI
ncbi:hypothetical protein V502_10074, partial [Pseudogymnoascus sp. VKM F-4520 (FW-2644)]